MRPRRKEISKESQILNDLKIQKHISNIKKAFVIMMDYTVSKSFSLLNFLPHQAISLTGLDHFLSFTHHFVVVSFDDIISKSASDIKKLAYRHLKLANVLRVSFTRKPFFTWASILLAWCRKLGWDFLNIFLNFLST